MERILSLRIILESPPPGVAFALQKGSGNVYETVQTQRSGAGDLSFTFEIRVAENKQGQPNFLGPYVQGPVTERFVYIDIGTLAGQHDSPWQRRLKVPLRDISRDVINKVNSDSSLVLEARVAGTDRKSEPACATVKPFLGWHVKPA